MAHRICPFWVGYFLLNPFRKLLENPRKILGCFIQEGMKVLEPGCGMGYFTLPIARMVGPKGRVVAVDIQTKMLSALRRRAEKAGLDKRIEFREAKPGSLGVEDLEGKIDFAVALHVTHEVPDQAFFFAEIWAALRVEGELLVIEPRGHVSQRQLQDSVFFAKRIGFSPDRWIKDFAGRGVLLSKSYTQSNVGGMYVESDRKAPFR